MFDRDTKNFTRDNTAIQLQADRKKLEANEKCEILEVRDWTIRSLAKLGKDEVLFPKAKFNAVVAGGIEDDYVPRRVQITIKFKTGDRKKKSKSGYAIPKGKTFPVILGYHQKRGSDVGDVYVSTEMFENLCAAIHQPPEAEKLVTSLLEIDPSISLWGHVWLAGTLNHPRRDINMGVLFTYLALVVEHGIWPLLETAAKMTIQFASTFFRGL